MGSLDRNYQKQAENNKNMSHFLNFERIYIKDLRKLQVLSGTNLALITKIPQTYLKFNIWSWNIYAIEIHIKFIYYHKFETKSVLIANTITKQLTRVKVCSQGGQWKIMEGYCNAYELYVVVGTAPIMRIVDSNRIENCYICINAPPPSTMVYFRCLVTSLEWETIGG